MHILGSVLLLFLIISCGKSNSRAGFPRTKAPLLLPMDGANVSGFYMAELHPLNPEIGSSIFGQVTIFRDGDKFNANVSFSGGEGGSWHQQNIHVGRRCPNSEDNLNGDRYLDVLEAQKVLGDILIPLDGDLNSQEQGEGVYPLADATGKYFYEVEASFEEMFQDLKSQDLNFNDRMAKLTQDSGLDISGLAVVIHGAPSGISLPSTVETRDGRPAHQTLPVACGVLKKVTTVPDDIDTEETPGPMGEGENSFPNERDTSSEDSNEGSRIPETSDEDGQWYRRVIDWWRSVWERERSGRRQTWAEGRR